MASAALTQSYSVRWVYANSSRLAGNVGYGWGSPLIVLDSGSNLQTSPLWVSFYAGADGSCRSSSTGTYQTQLQLRFGHDLVLTCLGSSSSWIQGLGQSLSRIARLGSTQPLKQDDYVEVANSTTSSPSSAVLSVSYIRVGEAANSMFEVVAAAISSVNDTSATRSLFVVFKEVLAEAAQYVPSPPSVQVYLPNDVLYPFYYE